MSLRDREKLNRVEELKAKLFSKDYQTKIGFRDGFSHTERVDVPDSWQDDTKNSLKEKFFMKTSMFKKFFIFSIVFFILALGYASYVFFVGSNIVSNDNIEISVLGNAFTAGGEDLPLQVEIANKNNSALELVDLVLEYPKSSSTDLSQDTEHIRESLGTIPAGSVKDENVKVMLFGEQGSTRQVKISIEYRVEGSNAIFVKDKLYDVSINGTPINLSVDAPEETTPNQDITLNVKATLNATKPASKMLIKVDYPAGFQFASAKPSPSFGNNVWNLGDLAPGSERNISILGKMVDVFDGEDKTFHIWSGPQSDSDKSLIGVVFNSLGHTVAIKKSSVEARLFINGVYQREYAINTKTIIQGNINWANNLDTKINDLTITAKISGNAVNKSTISASQGFYNSLTNSIIWDKNSQNNLAGVNPGDTGTVTFSLYPLSLFSGGSGMLTEPSVNIEVNITGKQSLEGYAVKNLGSSESKVVKIISDVGFATKALYYSGPFSNTGPIPPKVDKETTYTIVWTLSNTANNISNAQVSSTLPPWIRFVGPISPPAEDLTYNPSTKEILWKIGGIPRGTGITEAGREVAFQVALIPSLSQVNTAPLLINDAILTGHDDFANVNVRVNKSSLNTLLSNDPLLPPSGDRVVE